MALQTVNLTDTFDEWRIKTNTLGAGIVFDISPQLGGNLDLNSNDITGTGNINTTGALTVSGILTGASIAGTVAGTTQSVGNNTTLLATTAFVTAAVQLEDTIEEMNDTTISGSANLDLLQYNSGTSKWVNTAIGAVVGATQAVGNNTTLLATTAFVTAAVQLEDQLSELNDTTISGPANLDVLQYTGSVWENKTISGAGIPTLGFTIAMAVALG